MDKFVNTSNLTNPARRSATIVPHDVDEIAEVPRALYVGTGGDITGRLIDDTQDRVFRNVPDGAELAYRFAYIRATGTNAADFVGLY